MNIKAISILPLLLVASARASADELSGITAESLQAAARGPLDSIMSIIKTIFGDGFVQNPLTPGAPDSFMGQLIFIFNSIIFVVGAGLLGVLVLKEIAGSANSGEPLAGSGPAAAWFLPIRVGLGIFYTMPALKGFSLAQGLMMTVFTLGVGGGNIAANKMADLISSGVPIFPAFNTQSASPNLTTELDLATKSLFISNLCVIEHNAYSAQLDRADDGVNFFIHETQINTPDAQGWDFGPCGSVMLTKRKGEEERGDSTLGFRSTLVNYNQIAAAVQGRVIKILDQVNSQARDMASNYVSQYYKYTLDIIDLGVNYNRQLDVIAAQAKQDLNSAIIEATNSSAPDQGALNKSVTDNIKQKGWPEVGTLFSVFAEASSAVVDAQKAWQIVYNPRDTREFEREGINGFSMPSHEFEITASATSANQTVENQANNSIGQKIVVAIMNILAKNSGGQGLVNPVATAKNLGDYLTVAGEGLLAVSAATDIAENVPILGTITKMAAKAISTISTFAWILIGLGLFLSVWIPLFPFATWFTSVVVYICSTIECILFSQLAGFSHLHAGPGLIGDQNAMKLYQYFLNMLLRPAVMVISFAFASAAMVGLGTLLLNWIPTIIQAAQGNSTTGLATIAALILFLTTILFGLVNTCCQLIINIPNATLGWVGGHMDSHAAPIAGAAAAVAVRNLNMPTPAKAPAAPTGGEASKFTNPDSATTQTGQKA